MRGDLLALRRRPCQPSSARIERGGLGAASGDIGLGRARRRRAGRRRRGWRVLVAVVALALRLDVGEPRVRRPSRSRDRDRRGARRLAAEADGGAESSGVDVGDHRRGAPLVEASAMWSAIRRSIIRSRAGAGAAAHHHRDQRASVAMHGGQQIEAGGAGVAGLDAVDAVDAAEQVIVVADHLAVVVELVRREIVEVFGKALLQRAAEHGQVARGGDLLVVGQARGVAIDRARHAERDAPCASSSRRSSVSSWPIASAIATAMSLAERVTTALIASSTRDRLARRRRRAWRAPAPRRARRSGCASAASSRPCRAARTADRASSPW